MQNFAEYEDTQVPISILNGRVNAVGLNNFNYNNDPIKSDNNFKNDALSRNVANTPLSDLFFSQKNMDALQEGLRIMILDKSDGKYNIGKQSNEELKIIMRGVYLQYAKNYAQVPVLEQVKQLNKIILDWSVPRVMSNIMQKEKYLEDISTLPRPIDRPELSNMKGTKQLEFKSFF